MSRDGVPVRPRRFPANVLDRRLPHHFALGDGRLDEPLRELWVWPGSEVLPLGQERATL